MDKDLFTAKLIRVFEGLKLKAYDDNGKLEGGVWTIGIGHTRGVMEGDTLPSVEEAYKLFATDIREMGLVKVVGDRPILEYAALISYGFNRGLKNLDKLLRGEIGWDRGTKDKEGNVLAGLEARREFEKALVEVSKNGT